MTVISDLYEIIRERKGNPAEGSYTGYLFEKGLDKILKKVGEECTETIIAAKNGDKAELSNEICDLLYHLLVLSVECGLPLCDIEAELVARREKSGNLKLMKTVDKNS